MTTGPLLPLFVPAITVGVAAETLRQASRSKPKPPRKKRKRKAKRQHPFRPPRGRM